MLMMCKRVNDVHYKKYTMQQPNVSITTTLPYVNADPHIGFALEIVQSDIYARYARLKGHEVFFNTGTDEHGVKVYRKALEAGQEVQAYVDEYAARFELLKKQLNLSYNAFIRTTDPHHVAAAQEFWRRCAATGDIYKKQYQVKYCVGCELEKTDSELVDGTCPLHPNLDIELIDEENYFFRFSKYQQALLDLYATRPDVVVPATRLNEIRAFVERGLEDFSISRVKAKMPWGVPVPDDDTQVMYVWFDALVNYLSTLGWPDEKYAAWWPSTQCAGKDNLRQQAAMWQAMLMSAGIESSKQIVIHGFITSGGQKMSKSLGNVIYPGAVVEEYGTDTLRYFLARHVHPFEDSDVTLERIREVYNANLANGIGNLTARIMKMATTHLPAPVVRTPEDNVFEPAVGALIEQFEYNRALDVVFEHVGKGDAYIQETVPFKAIKDPATADTARADIEKLVHHLYKIAVHLEPFMPDTAQHIRTAIERHEMPATMFPRKQ
jgi:methionyl-tRNA synthetase